MLEKRKRGSIAIVAALMLFAAACGGSSDSAGSDSDSGAGANEEASATTASEGDSGSEASDSNDGTDEEAEPVTLRYQSLAWQQEAIDSNIAIVDAWNAENPLIQVEYVQGSWDSVQDQLLTEFETGEAPDLVHYESTPIIDFGRRGYLVDLSTVLSDEFMGSIRQSAWDTSTDEGAVYGAPFLMESSLFFANKSIFDEAGVELPTVDSPWTWDEFQAAAAELTTDDQFGVALPFKSPTNRVLNLSLGFDGVFFDIDDEGATAQFGPAEQEVPSRIHDMLYVDKSAAPDSLGFGSTDVLPGFFAGNYAMVTSGVWFRQQLSSQAPDGFEWVTLPPLAGTSQNQGSSSQTISMSIDSEHPTEAAAFLEYLLSPQNMANLALGDWLLPTGDEADAALAELTGGANGWDVAVESGRHLILAPYQQAPGFSQWKSEIANPAFQEYFADRIDLEELGKRLVEEGQGILDSAN